jgi:hypothetical protein
MPHVNYCSLHSTLVHSYHATPCLACRKAKRLLWVNPCFNKLTYCSLPTTLFHSLPLSSTLFIHLRYLTCREALRVLRVYPCVNTTRKLSYCSLHFTLFHSLHSPPSGTSRAGKTCVRCGSTQPTTGATPRTRSSTIKFTSPRPNDSPMSTSAALPCRLQQSNTLVVQ